MLNTESPSPQSSRIAAASAVERACFTDAGPQRDHNEDACSLPLPGADEARLGALLALADGVGGLPGGAVASRGAVSQLQALYYAAEGPGQPPERLRRCVEAVNALNRQAHPREEEDGYLTTLVAAVILGDQVWVANVGDSRAYLFQASTGLGFQLTEDHSGRVQILKSGLPGSEEAAQDAGSGITRAIGLTAECQVDIYHYTWSPGDCLVLVSDGLASLPVETMAGIVFEPILVQTAARLLVEQASRVDGSDNATAVVARWQPVAAERSLAEAFPATAFFASLDEPPAEPPEEQTGPLSIGPVASAQAGLALAKALPSHPTRRILLFAFVAGLLLGWVSAIVIIMLLLGTSNVLNLF